MKKIILCIFTALLILTASFQVFAENTDMTGLQFNQRVRPEIPQKQILKGKIYGYPDCEITYSNIYYGNAGKRPFGITIKLPNTFSNITAQLDSSEIGTYNDYTKSYYYSAILNAEKNSDSTMYYFTTDFATVPNFKTNTAIKFKIRFVNSSTYSQLFETKEITITFKDDPAFVYTPFIQKNSVENDMRVAIPLTVYGNNISNLKMRVLDSQNNVIAESDRVTSSSFANYAIDEYTDVFGSISYMRSLTLPYIVTSQKLKKKAQFIPGSYALEVSFDYKKDQSTLLSYKNVINNSITITGDGLISSTSYYSGYPEPNYGNTDFFTVIEGFGIDGKDVSIKYVDDANTTIAEATDEKCLSLNSNGFKSIVYKVKFALNKKFETGKNYYIIIVDKKNGISKKWDKLNLRIDPCINSVSYDKVNYNAIFNFKTNNFKLSNSYNFVLKDSNSNTIASKTMTIYSNNFTVDLSNYNTIKLSKNSKYYLSVSGNYGTNFYTITTDYRGVGGIPMVTCESGCFLYDNSKKLYMNVNFDKSLNVTTGAITLELVKKNSDNTEEIVGKSSTLDLIAYKKQYANGTLNEGVNVAGFIDVLSANKLPVSGCTYKVMAAITNKGVTNKVFVSDITVGDSYYLYYRNVSTYINNLELYSEIEYLKNGLVSPDVEYMAFEIEDVNGNIVQMNNSSVQKIKDTPDVAKYVLTAQLSDDDRMIESKYDLYVKVLGDYLLQHSSQTSNVYTKASYIIDALKVQCSNSGEKAVYGLLINNYGQSTPASITVRLYDADDTTNMSYKQIEVYKDSGVGNNTYCFDEVTLSAIDLTKHYDIVVINNGVEIGSVRNYLVVKKQQ